MTSRGFSLFRLLAALFSVSVLFAIGWHRLELDANVVELLPRKDPAISDALYIFRNHPIQDQVFIDISSLEKDPDLLVQTGALLERKLKESGLFEAVGKEGLGRRVPELMSSIADNLPVLFSKGELRNRIEPLLQPDHIQKRLQAVQLSLLNLEGIGQAEFIRKDPLGFREIVAARLSSLAPSQAARFYRGALMSENGRHLLVIARPIHPGTDTAFARRLEALLKGAAAELQAAAAASGAAVALTPVGAYRAALDNERIAKGDVKNAIVFATIGISLLLLLAFPRPYLGLMSLLPALAGTMTAFFVYSLLQKSISLMVLGFGGAIISIAVDHGIVYLLFLDRPQQTYGREASHEVRAVGLLATLTTVGAFGVLCTSDFPVFEQLGLFTALGISASFLFVHAVFPCIFKELPPARPRPLPLQRLANRLAIAGPKGMWMAFAFALAMLFFAAPKFNVNLSKMNTVTKETAAAEKMMGAVWGQVFNRIYLMLTGESLAALQQEGDRLLSRLDGEASVDVETAGLVSSMIFPGADRRQQNLAAWKKFWTPARVAALTAVMESESVKLGFRADAFERFYNLLRRPEDANVHTQIPEKFLGLLSITKGSDGTWIQVSALRTGESYDPEKFYARYRDLGKIFDPALFSERLGKILLATFVKMVLIIGSSVILLVFLFLLDVKLALTALLPIAFAFVCTLGTLNLMGHPLDIAGLMLAIVVIGMGIDYALFFVRSHQRYADPAHPHYALIRLAVLLAAASTMIGFGVLGAAKHTLLRGAGLTAFLGIGYAAIGAFVILPPLLNAIFRQRDTVSAWGGGPRKAPDRYRYLEAYPRLFVRIKLRIDPMFAELPALLPSDRPIRAVIDVGCGYGAPAAWLLERFPDARIYGIDPEPERVRVAAAALGSSGVVSLGRAPEIPEPPEPVDLALMLDMLHYIDDHQLQLALKRLRKILKPDGCLVIRTTLPPTRKFPLVWWWENFKCRLYGMGCHHRALGSLTALIVQTGWKIVSEAPSGRNGELAWLVLRSGTGEF